MLLNIKQLTKKKIYRLIYIIYEHLSSSSPNVTYKYTSCSLRRSWNMSQHNIISYFFRKKLSHRFVKRAYTRHQQLSDLGHNYLIYVKFKRRIYICIDRSVIKSRHYRYTSRVSIVKNKIINNTNKVNPKRVNAHYLHHPPPPPSRLVISKNQN